MSAPIYNGGLVGAIDADRRPYVKDDGNWSMQGTSEPVRYRALALYVDSRLAYGYVPAAQREPFESALKHEGAFTRDGALIWKGPICSPGAAVEIVLVGGNRHYYGAQGDDSGDWMEWASLDPVTLKPIVATTGVMIVEGETTPPPHDVDVIEQLATMVDNVTVEIAQVTTKSAQKWVEQNPGEARALALYLASQTTGEKFPPPDLKTHVGRAASGIAQNGVLCQDEL